MQSEEINELADALSKAQGQIEGAAKDSINPFHKSKYADIHSVITCAKEALRENGLSVVQPTAVIDGHLCLVTIIMHKSGQWIKGIVPMIADKADAQSMGKAFTYYRRYAYSSMLGISQFDDDGEEAMERKPKESAIEPKPKAESHSAPTIEDLEKAMIIQGFMPDRTSLAIYIKDKATELGVSEQAVIKRAVANQNGDLERFIKGYKKRFSILDNP